MQLINFLLFLTTVLADLPSTLRVAVEEENVQEANSILVSPKIDRFTLLIGLKAACEAGKIKFLEPFSKNKLVDKPTLQYVFWNACRHNRVVCVESLLKCRADDLQDAGPLGLFFASLAGHLEAVKALLQNADLDLRRTERYDPIMVAVENGHKDVVCHLWNFLRARTMSPERIELQNLLVKAAVSGDRQLVKKAITEEKALADGDNSYALLRACANGHLDVVDYLLKQEDHHPDPTYWDQYAIRTAYANGHTNVVERLLTEPGVFLRPYIVLSHIKMGGNESLACKMVAKMNADQIWDDMIEAALNMHQCKLLDALLGKGSRNETVNLEALLAKYSDDPEIKTILLKQSLFKAARNGSLETIKMLIEEKEVPASSDDCRILVASSAKGYLPVVEYLLVGTDSDPAAQNQKAIFYAAAGGHLDVVKRLLKDERVDPSALKQSALLQAIVSGHLEVVQVLLEDSRIKAEANGQRALLEAVKNNKPKIVALLLTVEAVDPSIQCNFPITYAASKGLMELARVLLSSPKVDASAAHNRAFHWAMSGGHYEMAKLLLKSEGVSTRWTRNIVAATGIREAMGVRDSVNQNQLEAKLNSYLADWGFTFPVDIQAAALKMSHPNAPSEIEALLANLFFDSHSFFFHREDIQLKRGDFIYETFSKVLENYCESCTESSENLKRLRTAYAGLSQLLDCNRALGLNNRREGPKYIRSRRKWIKEKLASLERNQKLTLPLPGPGHIAIGVWERIGPRLGNLTIFNSGDGTSTQVIGKDARQVMFEMFCGVDQLWLEEFVAYMNEDSKTPFRKQVYPSPGSFFIHYASKATIRGQRSGTCYVRSVQLYLLSTLGRPLYTRFKFTTLLNLLSSVYRAISTGNNQISFFGTPFQPFYWPVWIFLRQTSFFEEIIKRQIEKLDDKPLVTISIDEPEPGVEYIKEIKWTKEYSKKLLQEHCLEHGIEHINI